MISKIQTAYFQKIINKKAAGFNSQIHFGNNQAQIDTFELSKNQKSSKFSFLYDDSLEHFEKVKILNTMPEIISVRELVNEIKLGSTIWLKPEFFETETLSRYIPYNNKTSKTPIIDTSNPKNIKNYLILKNIAKKALSKDVFMKRFNMPEKTYDKCIENGTLERVQLFNKDTDEAVYIDAIIPSTEKNAETLARFEAFKNKKLN